MSRWTALLIVAACGASTGCITGFRHSLGPAEDGFIEPQLIGAWACTSTDEPKPSLITILDFDGKQYYIYGAGNGQGEPIHSRAFATRVEGVPFLSVRDIGEEHDDDWMFMAYVLPDADHLKLRLVGRVVRVVEKPRRHHPA